VNGAEEESIESAILTPEKSSRAPTKSDLLNWLNYRSLLLAVVVLAALVYSQFSIFKQPLKGDRVNWEYMAQVIARGGVPYYLRKD
jgi:hypothetical protein